MSKAGVSQGLERLNVRRYISADSIEVPVGKVFFPPEEHRLYHPRSGLPVKKSLRERIKSEGFDPKHPIVVWILVAEGGEATLDGTKLKEGDPLIVIGDGCRRTKASYDLVESGEVDAAFTVRALKFSGNEAEFHLMRQDLDSDLEKEPHSPAVVAYNFFAAKRAGGDEATIVATKPRDYALATAYALFRWKELSTVEAEALDSGKVEIDGKERAVGINILPALFDLVPPARRFTMLRELAGAGRKSQASARRYIRAQIRAREIVAEGGEADLRRVVGAPAAGPEEDPALGVPAFDDDGPFANEEQSRDEEHDKAEEGDDEPSRDDSPSPKNKSKTTTSGRRERGSSEARGQVKSPVEAVRAPTVRKAVELVETKPRALAEERAFFWGAKVALGPDERRAVAKEFAKLDPVLVHALAGMSWRFGHFPPTVQAHICPEVIAAIACADQGLQVKPNAAPAKTTKKKARGRKKE